MWSSREAQKEATLYTKPIMLIEIILVCGHCSKETSAIVFNVIDEEVSCKHCQKMIFRSRCIPGYLYILSNPHMPGLLKIGLTTRSIVDRVAELNAATGVPSAFNVEAYFESNDPVLHEKSLHRCLADYRVPGREFFGVSLNEAVDAARSITGNEPIEQKLIPDVAVWWRCRRCSTQFFSKGASCTRCGEPGVRTSAK